MPQLILYASPGCGFCSKVLHFMQSKGISIPIKNTYEGNNREELIKIGGKGQTPCLVIDGKALYESNDIVEWLDKNYKQ